MQARESILVMTRGGGGWEKAGEKSKAKERTLSEVLVEAGWFSKETEDC